MRALSGIAFSALACGHGRRYPAIVGGAEASCGPGRLVGLIGPNGSGKSTLLSTLSGILRPLAGSISLEGRSATDLSAQALSRLVAIVLTETERPIHATARDVASLGRHPHTGFLGFLSAADEEIVDVAMERAGASELADRPFAELSDGERRRVLIARALAQDTPIILLDEPEVFLDYPAKRRLMELLSRIAHEEGRSVVVSLHDIELALDSCDELWLLQRRAGAPSSLRSGVPEELAMDGSIGAAFGVQAADPHGQQIDTPILHDEGLCSTSMALGTMDLLFPRHPSKPPRGRFTLDGGTLVQRQWTSHLLSRLGFRSGPDLGAISIEGEQEAIWRLTPRNGQEATYATLGSVATALESGQFTTI